MIPTTDFLTASLGPLYDYILLRLYYYHTVVLLNQTGSLLANLFLVSWTYWTLLDSLDWPLSFGLDWPLFCFYGVCWLNLTLWGRSIYLLGRPCWTLPLAPAACYVELSRNSLGQTFRYHRLLAFLSFLPFRVPFTWFYQRFQCLASSSLPLLSA